MSQDYRGLIHKINYLTSEMNGLYHQASLRLGITDTISIVLYSIYDAGGECLLGEIQKNSGISKQTIHSAIRSLVEEGMVQLTPYDGRSKKVSFTSKGRQYAEETVARLYQAEIAAFHSWPEEEVATYICLMKQYNESFRREMEKL